MSEEPTTHQHVISHFTENHVSFQELEHEPVQTSQEACNVRQAAGWPSQLVNGAKALLMKSKKQVR
jgi:hypothetical protein